MMYGALLIASWIVCFLAGVYDGGRRVCRELGMTPPDAREIARRIKERDW